MGEALSRHKQARLFDRLNWMESLHQLALHDRPVLLLRTQWQEAEAWLPLMQVKGRRYEGLANYYNFTFAPSFVRAYGDATRTTIMTGLAHFAKAHCDRIDLYQVPDEDGTASLIAEAFDNAGWICRREKQDVNHVLPVQGRSFADYWRSRPGPLRSTVKRKMQKNRVSIRIERRFIAQLWADYEAVYAQSWKPEEGSPAFLRRLAEQEGAAGCLRLGVAYIDGAPVAAQFWTVEHGVALIHKLAHHKDHVAHSPGTLLSYAMFQAAIDEDRVATIDFGTGDDDYKRDWMESVRPRYHLRIMRPMAPANWPVMVRHGWNRLAARRAED